MFNLECQASQRLHLVVSDFILFEDSQLKDGHLKKKQYCGVTFNNLKTSLCSKRESQNYEDQGLEDY